LANFVLNAEAIKVRRERKKGDENSIKIHRQNYKIKNRPAGRLIG
jgi:hypothetical protein